MSISTAEGSVSSVTGSGTEPEERLRLVIALDVGGTLIKGAVTTEAREILVSREWHTQAEGGPEASVSAVLAAASDLVTEAQALGEPLAVGLVAPGIVDEPRGSVVFSENLGWDRVPIAALVCEHVGLPVAFGHDVRAGGLAEAQMGAGVGADPLVFLPIGTGLAAAIIAEGKLLSGSGFAGELGHGGATSGVPCVCGGQGCIETYASASGMAREYTRLSGIPAAGALDVQRAAEAGDQVALDVWAHAIEGLADVIADLVRTLGETRIVIGGGLVKAGPVLLAPLTEAVRRRLTFHPMPDIVPARLGDRAGTWGAALVGWQAAEAATA
jgi:glucokinase